MHSIEISSLTIIYTLHECVAYTVVKQNEFALAGTVPNKIKLIL